MHQEGLEPSAYRLEGGCSIRLSYWCKIGIIYQQTLPCNAEIPLTPYDFKKHQPICKLTLLSGAGDEIRTRDIQLGRLSLYQLSYSRKL